MEVFERPADTYVAGFIGAPAMNFLPATLVNSGTAARLEAGPILGFVDGRRDRPDGTALIIGIRPEHIRVDRNGLSLRIDLVEPLGSETLVHGHLAATGEPGLVIRLAGKPPEGEVLTIDFPPEQIHVFDAETGQRLS
jgi:sn-glycerol 3-phosphate transport system ATP-binding protein